MWFDPIMAGLLRSPLHPLLSNNAMLITVRGRKSGRAVTTPVNYVRHGDELLTVSLRSRRWWRNLRGRQTPVELLLAGAPRPATARVEEAVPDVGRGLAEVAVASPMMARGLHITLDPAGQPLPADLARTAASRVIVRMRLSAPA